MSFFICCLFIVVFLIVMYFNLGIMSECLSGLGGRGDMGEVILLNSFLECFGVVKRGLLERVMG